MMKKPNGYWTLEKCIISAKNYATRTEWSERDMAAYAAAKRNKWIDICCTHMTRPKPHNFKWTKEKCIKDAQKYHIIKEWNKNSSGAYAAASKNKWLNDCTIHMFRLQKPHNYWTKEKCIEEAKKYCTIKEWKKYNLSSYIISSKNKWIKECTEYMIRLWELKWITKEACIKESKKYNTLNEWIQNSIGSHRSACSHGWLAECCQHMIFNKKPYRYWTKERCVEDAKKYSTIADWQFCSISAYAIAHRNRWLKECCAHMKKLTDSIYVVKLMKIFKLLNIKEDVEREKQFDDFRFKKTNGIPKYDFAVHIKDAQSPFLIEEDGHHHFQPVRFKGMSLKCAKINFKKQKIRDKEKNLYAEIKGYPLLRIKYIEFKNIKNVIIKVAKFLGITSKYLIDNAIKEFTI